MVSGRSDSGLGTSSGPAAASRSHGCSPVPSSADDPPTEVTPARGSGPVSVLTR